jgi:hypothetical protein
MQSSRRQRVQRGAVACHARTCAHACMHCCTQNAPEQSPSVVQPAAPGQTTKKPEVMDDFLRNFFVKMGLSRTCEMFEAEWYEMKATGRLEGSQLVPRHLSEECGEDLQRGISSCSHL